LNRRFVSLKYLMLLMPKLKIGFPALRSSELREASDFDLVQSVHTAVPLLAYVE
jgi:hypothetical protein